MPKGTDKHGGRGARANARSDADGRIRELFADGGPLSEVMDGYRRRPEQESYALAVAESLDDGGVLLADVPTGTGKCLHGDTLLTLSDGSRRRIADLVGLVPEVVQLGSDWRMRAGRVAACYESGVKEVFRIRTRLGHELTASADHPLLTVAGWRKVGELRPGDKIAAARDVGSLGRDPLENSELAFLGLMISDGGCSVLDSAYFTNTEPRIVEDLRAAAGSVGNLVVKPQKRGPTYRVVRGPRKGLGRRVPNDAVALLRRHGVLVRTAPTKTIPEAVFRLPSERLAVFLGRLWSGDGCVEVGRRVASYSSSSRVLAHQVRHLLLRLGAVAKVRRHDGVFGGVRFPAWNLEVTEADNLRRFADTVGRHLVGPKAERIAAVVPALPPEGNPNRDLLPPETWDLVEEARLAAGASWRSVVRASGASDNRRRGISRRKLALIAALLGDEGLSGLARSDVYWDAVVSIEPAGRAPTYDITMADGEPPNFLADDLVVHNSLAYLAAAVLRGNPVVVSTATVQLQTQLQTEDAPVLSRAVALMDGRPGGEGFTHGVIKGRGNFLCIRRHEESLREGTLIGGALMGKLDRFRSESETGDREDLDFAVPGDVWREVASMGEDCSPGSCPYRDGCFVYAARERAADRDATFVNHAMLLANVAASGSVFDTEGRDLVIDEAHALEGVMNEAFGSSVTHQRVLYSMRLARKKSDAAASHADRAEAAADLFFDDLRRAAALGSEEAAPRAYGTLKDSLRSVKEALAADPKEEANELSVTVGRLSGELASFYSAPRPTHAYAVVQEGSAGGFGGGSGKGFVDKSGRRSAYPELKSWLVDTDAAFTEELLPLFAGGGASLCSATLAEGETNGGGRSFSYVRRRLGLSEGEGPAGRRVREHSGREIFDYAGRALVYVARDLPAPVGAADASRAHTRACVGRAEELVGLSGGRALILLSTNRAVAEFRAAFRPPYTVRFQGDDSTGRLVRWLKESEDGAVLVGTRGMWQGLSVPGEALGLVVLDKVPFVPPGDPVFEALKTRSGEAWFREVALPKARVAVRQGAGRLMRTDTDRGVIALLDPRIGTKGWGKAILGSLPPAPMTSGLEDVAAFYTA